MKPFEHIFCLILNFRDVYGAKQIHKNTFWTASPKWSFQQLTCCIPGTRFRATLGWCLSQCIREADLSMTSGTQRNPPNHKVFKTHDRGGSSWNQSLIKMKSVFRQLGESSKRKNHIEIYYNNWNQERDSECSDSEQTFVSLLWLVHSQVWFSNAVSAFVQNISVADAIAFFIGSFLSFLLMDNKEGDEHFHILYALIHSRELLREKLPVGAKESVYFHCENRQVGGQDGAHPWMWQTDVFEKLPICWLLYAFYFFKLTCLIKLELCFQKK